MSLKLLILDRISFYAGHVLNAIILITSGTQRLVTWLPIPPISNKGNLLTHKLIHKCELQTRMQRNVQGTSVTVYIVPYQWPITTINVLATNNKFPINTIILHP
jgi:hypothetical protein